MKKPILVVMAAGMGSRYGGLKQIDPVGKHGEAILDYSLFDARRAGFETVVFIIKHEIETAFKETVGARVAKSEMEIRYSYQQIENLPAGYNCPEGRVKPWGTSHAILSASDAIDAPFAVINADDYYGPEAFATIYNFLIATPTEGFPYKYAMVGFLLKNTVSENGYVSRGVCVPSEHHHLRSVTEHTHIETTDRGLVSTFGGEEFILPEDTIVSMNLWGFTRSFVDETIERFPLFLDNALAQNPMKAEYYLPSVVSELLAEKKATVKVLTSHDKWYGVTYQEDKATVMQAIAEKTEAGLYPCPLWDAK
ncbi:MAG: nucleotidyltransferase [Faecalibacterium sp.]